MPIRKEFLESKHAELTRGRRQIAEQIEQLKADLAATDGAMQLCEQLIAQMDAEKED